MATIRLRYSAWNNISFSGTEQWEDEYLSLEDLDPLGPDVDHWVDRTIAIDVEIEP